jgi:hypothetical protein
MFLMAATILMTSIIRTKREAARIPTRARGHELMSEHGSMEDL